MAFISAQETTTGDLWERWRRVVVVGVAEVLREEIENGFRRILPGATCRFCDRPMDDGDPDTLLVLPYCPGSYQVSRLEALRRRGNFTPALLLVSLASADPAPLPPLMPAAFLIAEPCGAGSLVQALSQLALIEHLFAELQGARRQLQRAGPAHPRPVAPPGPLPLEPASTAGGQRLESRPGEASLIARIEEEVRAARRRRMPLCCQIFRLVDFPALRARRGAASADDLAFRIARLLKRRLVVDLVGYCGEGELVVVSRRLAMEAAVHRARSLAAVLSRKYAVATTYPQVRVGIAFLREGMEGALDLLSAARQVLDLPGPQWQGQPGSLVFPPSPLSLPP